MSDFSFPLIGGLLIGLASTVLLMGLGKIAGISGIASGVFHKFKAQESWKLYFILGLLVGGFLLKILTPSYFSYELKFSSIEAVVGGVLVGFGTRLGSGCTSGHGVCGLPRLSLRSFVATGVFMSVAILTVYLRG